jgi:prophage regulatory protein
MINFPETAFLRLSQILGDLDANPPVAPIIPVSRSAWWAGVKTGTYPPPVKLSPRVTVWRASDVFAIVTPHEKLITKCEITDLAPNDPTSSRGAK